MTTRIVTCGVHHVGLTVPDIRATCRFFIDALGFEQVGERPAYPAVFVSDGTVMLTLWQAREGARAFDRKDAVGLHHLALAVSDEVGLDEVHARLEERSDVEIEFPPEPLGGGATRHMMLFVPGGVRIELIQPGGS
jgi:catechol 2,3-dioxygenase-like lactoylglutathione lyase family enzyme